MNHLLLRDHSGNVFALLLCQNKWPLCLQALSRALFFNDHTFHPARELLGKVKRFATISRTEKR
jgi:hypothetical protein